MRVSFDWTVIPLMVLVVARVVVVPLSPFLLLALLAGGLGDFLQAVIDLVEGSLILGSLVTALCLGYAAWTLCREIAATAIARPHR